MTPSPEGWPTKAKETPPHEVRLAPLDANLVFKWLGDKKKQKAGLKNHLPLVHLVHSI